MSEPADVLNTAVSMPKLACVFPWEESMPDRHARPRNPFIPFTLHDVEQSIPERLEQQVDLYPDRLAVKDRDLEFTYHELNQVANRVAWAILSEVGEGASRVTMLFEQRALAIASFMGALKAGKTYVPLDGSYPHARLALMIHDSESDLILCDGRYAALAGTLAQEAGCRAINVQELDSSSHHENPGLAISPDAYAYIIYTSGSTGAPKGVIENHRNVLHHTMVYTNGWHLHPEDRLGLLASLAFSGSVGDIYGALLNGAAVIAYGVQEAGIGRLAEWLIEERITKYESVPALFRQLCQALTPDHRFPHLRIVGVGGDRVEKGDVDLCLAHFPDAIFHVGLGATEAKIISRYFVDKDSQIADSVLPVGYAVDDVEILLLDEDKQPVEPGQPGEIVVKSRYLSPGYWRQPELTASKFWPDPARTDERLYFTGDVGRMAADGCLTHLGRKDFQVKIRGFRVETAEIEAALLDLEGTNQTRLVREAVVVARQRHPGGNQQLVAYFVPALRPAPATSTLRRLLAERLPDYMVPALFVPLSAMPLNANAKIDRQALPDPDPMRPELETPYVAPRDALESEIASIWEEVLGLQPVGVQDSFYELGGDSLLVARLFAQIGARLDGDANGEAARSPVSLETFFRFPTVEQLASIYRQRDASAGRGVSAGESAPRPRAKARKRAFGYGLHRDSPLVEVKNRLLQVLALYAPGARSIRVRLHRMRGVRIGKEVFIGLGVIIESGHPRMVSIGNRVTISVRSVIIAHFGGSARWALLSDGASVRIEDNVYIGPGVIVLPNVTIGQGAVVAAGSVVTQSVPPLTMVQGNPAKKVAECGIPLVGNTYEQFVRNLRFVED